VQKKALGKGLKALIGEPEAFATYDSSSWQHIMVDEIEPNPLQPRDDFDEAKMAELVSSIKAHGVLQPIIVRRAGDKYQIIAGERRWRAAQTLNIMSIPAIIRDATDQDMLKIALIENLQRENLNPIEEAHAYTTLIERHDLTQEALADHLGKDRSTIANIMRLLGLPTDIQAHVSRGTISMGHARALLSLPDQSAQRELCQLILDEGLSVRQVENLVKKPSAMRKRRVKSRTVPKDPDIRRLEEDLQRALGTKVKIRTTGKRGKIEIEFYSPDEFEAIVGKLLEERL
jgi:ParB family chromosome partitioning protein